MRPAITFFNIQLSNSRDHGAIHPDYRIYKLSELPELLEAL